MTHEVRNVYDLEGLEKDRRLWIVAPGPTSLALKKWAHLMVGETVIALNSALEIIPKPTYWLYADKRFSWLYGHELHGDKGRMKPGLSTPHRVIVPHHQTKKMQHYYAGGELYSFHFQMEISRRLPVKDREGKPFWYAPTYRFIPGHASVASTACSIACLMRPRVAVLVGVDFAMPDDVYYHPEVKKNLGPTMKTRALDSGLSWFRGALTKRGGIWPGLRLITTSVHLASRAPVVHRNWEEIENGDDMP